MLSMCMEVRLLDPNITKRIMAIVIAGACRCLIVLNIRRANASQKILKLMMAIIVLADADNL